MASTPETGVRARVSLSAMKSCESIEMIRILVTVENE